MCNIGIVLGDAGVKLPTAILFMNSNKSERNIRKKVAKAREKCMSQGIVLGHDVVINKGLTETLTVMQSICLSHFFLMGNIR